MEVSGCKQCRPAFKAMHSARAFAKRWKRAAKHLAAQLNISLEQENARIADMNVLREQLALAKAWLEADDHFEDLKWMQQAQEIEKDKNAAKGAFRAAISDTGEGEKL